MTMNEILLKFSAGEYTMDEANEALKEIESTIYLREKVYVGEKIGVLDDGIGLEPLYINDDLTLNENLLDNDDVKMIAYFKGNLYKVSNNGEKDILTLIEEDVESPYTEE